MIAAARIVAFCIGILFILSWTVGAQEAGTDLTVTISRPAVRAHISPNIYGMAVPSASVVANWRVPLIRWGGNTAERYNWKLGNAWNTGKDWFFENVAVLPQAWQNFLERADRTGALVFFNLPLIGFAAKDTTSHAYSIRKYGPQQKHDPHRPDAGNGVHSGGKPVTGNDAADTSIVADPEFVAAWVRAMKKEFPKLFAHRRVIFGLGNEPMLWHITHRDVHPEPVSYDEYLDRFVAMAKAVKGAAPESQIAGPELWGWPVYFQSALDLERKDNGDRRRHGGQDFLPWFLRQMRAQEKQGGVRLLDYVTVHYYPQARDVFSAAVNLEATRLRIETVRSLWDPGYRDPSWINARAELIPRLKRWVAEAYPGTKIGLTEYNWGGEEDMSGALALADILGILGREGVDLASYWTTPLEGSFAAAAYAVYRNADGAGAGFGDEKLTTRWEGAAPENFSVYAARDDHGKVVSVVAVNKSALPRNLRVRWQGLDVESGPGYVLEGKEPRVAATKEWASPLQVLRVAPRSVVHWRFRLK